jgi:hypothetical protein
MHAFGVIFQMIQPQPAFPKNKLTQWDKINFMMHSVSHITPEMMKTVLDDAFSSSVTQTDKHAAKHLRSTLVGTHGTYASVLFDISEMAAGRDRTVLAEMAFLIGLQAGYELGIAHPPPAE